MTYKELIKLILEREFEHNKTSLTEEEARLYYGDELCNAIEKIYKFCKESDYIIYQHATDLESADNIVKRGFICSTNELSEIPIDVSIEEPVDIEYNDEGVKTYIYNGEQCEVNLSGLKDRLVDGQHFFENICCNLDFGSITNPFINRSGVGATCLFAVSKNVFGSREWMQYGRTESHFDEWEDCEVPETYFSRQVIPKQFCIGYLDVEDKKFVFNHDFQFDYGVTDDFALGVSSMLRTDLSSIIQNSGERKNKK